MLSFRNRVHRPREAECCHLTPLPWDPVTAVTGRYDLYRRAPREFLRMPGFPTQIYPSVVGKVCLLDPPTVGEVSDDKFTPTF